MRAQRNVAIDPASGKDLTSSLFPRLTWRGIATSTCLLAVPVVADAAPVFTLNGSLNPGDHYRLAFVTSTTVVATSTSIATYNSFVTGAAAASILGLPATSWAAIGSTAAINAITNIACGPDCGGDPIFLVDGTKVASTMADLFDGAILSPINRTQNGALVGNYVWTGSNSNGTTNSNPLGSANPQVGAGSASGAQWLSITNVGGNGLLALYGISGDVVVPGAAAVPEPAGTPLFVLGGLMAFAARKFRRGERRVV